MNGFAVALLTVVTFACGWFGRGWWDGSDISVVASAEQGQEFVTAASEATTRIDSAEAVAEASRNETRERVRYVEVAKGCPAGVGPVSPDMRERLRVAFEEGSEDGPREGGLRAESP